MKLARGIVFFPFMILSYEVFRRGQIGRLLPLWLSPRLSLFALLTYLNLPGGSRLSLGLLESHFHNVASDKMLLSPPLRPLSFVPPCYFPSLTFFFW